MKEETRVLHPDPQGAAVRPPAFSPCFFLHWTLCLRQNVPPALSALIKETGWGKRLPQWQMSLCRFLPSATQCKEHRLHHGWPAVPFGAGEGRPAAPI